MTILAIASVSAVVHAQFNTQFHQNLSNSSPAGYVGVGTSPTGSPVSGLPSFNFHVHGVSNYTYTVPPEMVPIGGGQGAPGYAIDYGISARIGLTNSITGKSDLDGAMILMSKNDLIIKNNEVGDFYLGTNGVGMRMSGSTQRIFIGGSASSSQDFAKLNVVTSENGMSIKTNNASNYALRLKVPNNTSNLIEAFGQDNTKANFQVTGGGEVYARRYITTLQPFPDYVFQPDYKLKTFDELRTFINTNKHLPNMPTAVEVEENGADIGEINRLLVEKVEELTLYILELEERVVEVESTDEEESELQERITRLEKLILELSK